MDDLIDQIPDNWDNRTPADESFWREVDSHPAFATAVDPDDLTPAVEAIQAIKFDEETPLDCAQNYKEEGNVQFKRKNYILAIRNYTKALSLKLDNNAEVRELKCILLTNRGMCHFFQKNYRMCIKDCLEAVKLKKGHAKAYYRAALAAGAVGKYEEALGYCEKGLEAVPDHIELTSLQEKYVVEKEKLDEKKAEAEKDSELDKFIRNKGIHISSHTPVIEIPDQHLTPPKIDNKGGMEFNILLLYPETGQTDYLVDVSEQVNVSDILRSIFTANTKSVEWDHNSNYMLFTPNFKPALQVYIQTENEVMANVPLNEKLLSVLTRPEFSLRRDLVVELHVVSIMSVDFYREWKVKNCVADDL